MKNKAFTLIELLVVILIIGILAAIAFPQYKKVVFKSKFKELKVHLHEIKNAEERLLAETGSYTSNRNNLDIEFPLSKNLSSAHIIQTSKDIQCGIEGSTRRDSYKSIYCTWLKPNVTLFYMLSIRHYVCCNHDLSNSYNDEFCKKEMNTSVQSQQFSNTSRRCYEEKH